jgi:hypothetical protein
MEVESLRIRREIPGATRPDRLDLAVCNYYCLIIKRRDAGAVDYSHVGQDNHRSLYANKLLSFGSGALDY